MYKTYYINSSFVTTDVDISEYEIKWLISEEQELSIALGSDIFIADNNQLCIVVNELDSNNEIVFHHAELVEPSV